MSFESVGKLIPVGGGDPIPLVRNVLKIGRRDSCDICLKFAKISGEHCELTYADGYWRITDLGSTNGTKVNGVRIQHKKLRPGDEITIADRRFTIEYIPEGPVGKLADDSAEEDIDIPLLEKAGLVHERRRNDPSGSQRFRRPRR
ncbi:MAG: hypothetical protein KatS3mg105_3223 [Gemmatales bacterium]|nr:MAG: hypothetical protein KatS3mg105_3223 [Gemmatales bacterium]